MLKKGICCLLTAGMLLAGTGMYSFAEPAENSPSQEAQTELSAYSEQVYDDDRFCMMVNQDASNFALYDKSTDMVYHALPPTRDEDFTAAGLYRTLLNSIISITYYDPETLQIGTANSFVDSLNEGGSGIRRMKRGVELKFYFPSLGFTVPLQVQIDKDALSLKIPTQNIKEEGTLRLLDISVAPFFGAAGADEEGFLLVPDGSGALIRFQNGKTQLGMYSGSVYGEDLTDVSTQYVIPNEAVRLPVFGMKRGNVGYTGIITSGAAQAKITADGSGTRTSFNHAYVTFEWRKSGIYTLEGGWQSDQNFLSFQKGTPAESVFEVKYYFPQNGCELKDMAAVVRDYLTEAGAKPVAEKGGTVLSFLGALMKKRSIIGIPLNVQKPVTTISEMQSIVEELLSDQVDIAAIRYLSWNQQEIKGKSVKSAKISSAVGSKKDWKAFAENCQEWGIGFYPSARLTEYQKGNYPFSSYFNSVRGVDGAVTKVKRYALNTWQPISGQETQLSNADQLQKNVTSFLKSYEKLGTSGLDTGDFGRLNYSDFSNGVISREKLSEIVKQLLLQASDKSKLMLSEPNAYTVPYLTWAVNLPLTCSQLVIEDESVPFYQMCLSGFVNYTSEPINLEHSPDTALIKALQNGAYPHYVLGKSPSKELLQDTEYQSFVGIEAASVISLIKEQTQAFQEAVKQLGDYVIADYQILPNGVTKTIYQNGAAVLVNLTEKAVVVNGEEIKPNSFRIEKEGMQ